MLANIKRRFGLDVDFEQALATLDPELWNSIAHADAAMLMLTEGVDRLEGSCTSVAFRAQDAESLLDQASAIIDRALADRTTWKSLLERWATLRIDLFQSVCLEVISQNEEQHSRFDYEADIAKGQREGRDRKAAALASQQTKITNLRDNVDTSKDTAKKEVIRRGAMAYVRDMPNQQFISQPITTDVPPDGPLLFHVGQGGDGSLKRANWEMARDQAKAELDRQLISVDAETEAVRAQTEELDAHKKGLETQFTWTDANRTFLRQRAWTARQALLLKLSMANQGHALDFRDQAASVKTRYVQAISDAYSRLKAVETGLSAYYGYPFPDTRPDPLPTFVAHDTKTHDEIVAWTRRVAHWIAAFSKRTNNYILPLSLKSRTGNEFVSGLSTGSWTFLWRTSSTISNVISGSTALQRGP
jgi:hypothetical protein